LTNSIYDLRVSREEAWALFDLVEPSNQDPNLHSLHTLSDILSFYLSGSWVSMFKRWEDLEGTRWRDLDGSDFSLATVAKVLNLDMVWLNLLSVQSLPLLPMQTLALLRKVRRSDENPFSFRRNEQLQAACPTSALLPLLPEEARALNCLLFESRPEGGLLLNLAVTAEVLIAKHEG